MNIGPNPTFGEASHKVEVHLIGCAEDLYHQPLEVDFLARLRFLAIVIHPFWRDKRITRHIVCSSTSDRHDTAHVSALLSPECAVMFTGAGPPGE